MENINFFHSDTSTYIDNSVFPTNEAKKMAAKASSTRQIHPCIHRLLYLKAQLLSHLNLLNLIQQANSAFQLTNSKFKSDAQ